MLRLPQQTTREFPLSYLIRYLAPPEDGATFFAKPSTSPLSRAVYNSPPFKVLHGKYIGSPSCQQTFERGRGAIKGPIPSINSVSILLLGPEETLENSESQGAGPHRASFGQLPRLTKWLSLRQHYMHATVFTCFSHTTGPPLGHQPQLQAALEVNTTRPWPNGKRRDIRPVLATPGSDVGLSTCKMAAHHRQNTAGRRKVQVGRTSSSTSRAWLAAPAPHPAKRSLQGVQISAHDTLED